MQVYFEIDGHLVNADDLELHLGSGSPLALLARRKAERILRYPQQVCPQHQQPAAAILRLKAGPQFGLHVEACCQPFWVHVQERLARLTDTGSIAARPPQVGNHLIIRIDGHNQLFTFNLTDVDRLVIGRHDPDTGHSPDIDLSAYGAYEQGVSRRHASIVLWNRGLYLIDEGSPNGTFLNEQRLVPQEAQLLKFGDRIRIGRLKLEILLKHNHSQQQV